MPKPATSSPRAFITLILIASLAFAGCGRFGGDESGVWIPGYGFNGIHGLTFDAEGNLYGGSVVGQTTYRIDPETGESSILTPPPLGMADDLEFSLDGETLVWTSFILGKVHARTGDGPIRELATGLPGMNSIAFKQDGRLFSTQVFLGDALYELDPSGANPPRKIMEDMGGLNGFDFGPDGLLYGPLWFKGQVARVDVDAATLEIVAEGFKVPAAVNFDSQGNLYVLDSGAGEIYRVDTDSGEKHMVSEFKTAMDNLAFNAEDRLFVSVMSENAVFEIDTEDGSARPVKQALLGIPAGLAISSDGENLFMADLFALRRIKTRNAKITDLARNVASELEYPSGISASPDVLYMTSWFSGTLQSADPETGAFYSTVHDLVTPYDVVHLGDGSALITQTMAGNLLRISGEGEENQQILAEGLALPTGIANAPGGSVYVSEYAAGRISLVNLETGESTPIAEGLMQPEGLTTAPDGRVVVVEVGKARVIAINPDSGMSTVIAEGLPIGLGAPAGTAPPGVLSDVAVAPDGTVYVTTDLDDAVHRFRLD